MRQQPRTATAWIMAGCAAVLLAGCTGGDGEATGDASPAPADSAPTAAAPGADDGLTEAETSPTPQEAATGPGGAAGEPVATVSVPIGFIEDGELQIAVGDLEVAGELLRVPITFTASLPLEAEKVAIGAVLTANENAPAAGIFPELIDPVNLKAYEVVAGAVPNGTSVDLMDGVPRTLVFYFAAPQDDVETFDVVMSSQAPTLTDVPLQP